MCIVLRSINDKFNCVKALSRNVRMFIQCAGCKGGRGSRSRFMGNKTVLSQFAPRFKAN